MLLNGFGKKKPKYMSRADSGFGPSLFLLSDMPKSMEVYPLFHLFGGICKPHIRMRYVTIRPPYRKRKSFPIDATQLILEGIG